MMTVTLALAATLAAGALQADTVIPVERGARLDVEHPRGQVTVQVWDRDAVRVTGGNGAPLDIARRGSVLRVRSDLRALRRENAELSITLPRWMDMEIRGHQTGVRVDGAGGEVLIEILTGDVAVEGGVGRVTLRTLQGDVRLRGARGRVDVRAVNNPVTLEEITGDVTVDATNGGIVMRRVRSGSVRATTVNGGIRYEGQIQDNGRYAFTTHNGSIDVTMPDAVNATVAAVSYMGAFNAEFPVRRTGVTRDRHYNFTLGSGSARVELESFNGTITLRRP
jgi:DUF4097 and DUF4098 domain-containing protein YvlB